MGNSRDLPPVILSRAGVEEEISIQVGTNVLANTEFKVTTEREEMELHAIEMEKDAWLILEIPEFKQADAGMEVASLDALRKANDTAYYQAGDALWVKLVSPGDSGIGGHSGGVLVNVSR